MSSWGSGTNGVRSRECSSILSRCWRRRGWGWSSGGLGWSGISDAVSEFCMRCAWDVAVRDDRGMVSVFVFVAHLQGCDYSVTADRRLTEMKINEKVNFKSPKIVFADSWRERVWYSGGNLSCMEFWIPAPRTIVMSWRWVKYGGWIDIWYYTWVWKILLLPSLLTVRSHLLVSFCLNSDI